MTASTYDGTNLIHARTLRLPDDWVANGDARVSLCARGFAVYVGLESQLHKLSGGVLETIELARPIRSIAALEGSNLQPLAVSADAGGLVIWPPLDRPHIEPFATELTEPVIGFTRSGWLIAADKTALEIFRLNPSARHVIWHATEDPPAAAPIAILTAAHEDQFALLMANGRIRLFSLPRHA